MQVFETILQDDKVKGKPILMLCNKADIDEAKDEVHVVNTLKVESLVNIAREHPQITFAKFDWCREDISRYTYSKCEKMLTQ